MNWVILILLNSLATAFVSVLDKWLLKSQQRPSSLAFTTSFGIVGMPVASIGLIVWPLIPWWLASKAFIAGVIFLGAAWLYHDTIARNEEISRLSPLLQLTAAHKLLLASVFLGENLMPQQQLAIGIMVVSSGILILRTNNQKLRLSHTALRMLPVTILLAISGILLADVYRRTSTWHGIIWENVGTATGALAILIVMVLRSRVPRDTRVQTWGILIWEQSIRLATGIIPALAIANGMPVALPSALSGFRWIFVWILAVFFLNEKITGRGLLLKGSSISGLIVGIYLLTI